MKRLGIRSLALVILTLASAAAATAQGTLSRQDLDKRLDRALYDVTAIAAKLFNAGNEEGCCRLFEGALRTAVPLLDHQPALKKRVEDRLEKARTVASMNERAFILREAVDDIRTTLKKAAGPKPVALWDRLGGEKALAPVIKDFVAAAAADPKVNVSRNGKFQVEPAKIERNLLEFFSSVTGGPLKYTGRTMKAAHAGMQITDAEFDAAGAHLLATLNKHKVPVKETNELMSIIGSFKKDIVEGKPKAPPAPAPIIARSLWERLGGEDAVKAVVHDLVATAVKDPKVNFTRNGKYKPDDKGIADLEKLLVEFIGANTGGPKPYTGRAMKTVHAGMGITEAEFTALADDLVASLKKFKVPQKEIDDLIAVVATTKKDIVEKK
jgi:hemoglobin